MNQTKPTLVCIDMPPHTTCTGAMTNGPGPDETSTYILTIPCLICSNLDHHWSLVRGYSMVLHAALDDAKSDSPQFMGLCDGKSLSPTNVSAPIDMGIHTLYN